MAKLTAFYINPCGMVKKREWNVGDMAQAKTFLESSFDDYSKPMFELQSLEEDGVEKTRFMAFPFSHIDVVESESNNN